MATTTGKSDDLNSDLPLRLSPFIGMKVFSLKNTGTLTYSSLSTNTEYTLEFSLTGLELGTYLEYQLSSSLGLRLRLAMNSVSPELKYELKQGTLTESATTKDFDRTTLLPLSVSLFYQYSEGWGFHFKFESVRRKITSKKEINSATEFDLSGSAGAFGLYHIF